MNRAAKEACLGLLKPARLRAVVDALEIRTRDRRSKAGLIEGIIDGVSDFADVLNMLKLPELRQACLALGLDTKGNKPDLVSRLSSAELKTQPDDAAAAPAQTAPATSGLKSSLRRFVLDSSGAVRGREAGAKFVRNLLEAFGWRGGPPSGLEMPATLSIVEDGQRVTREVALLWKERGLLLEVVAPQIALDVAWKDVLRAALQVSPSPQYVILTNQRDIHLYDLARNREAPRLATPIDDLAKHSAAFPFLAVDWQPGATPTIVDVGKVSREVADLVAKLYRSLRSAHPDLESEVTQFTLQCIITMFAEDIGLLSRGFLTDLLYEGARHGDASERLGELFRLMSTREVPSPRSVPFFNGGLFSNPVRLNLDAPQLAALTRAAESDWRYVDPHIFGSVFQGIMDDDERHASGAHYTAHDDIMRVVGPTIVEPWRQRLHQAVRLEDLLEVRAALFKFRVADYACGSGNFLYVAFRELYRLDTELLARAFREFPSTRAGGRSELRWSIGIPTSNFFGMDINSFAVELAKVTLNIAKKIAFEERKAVAAEASAQLEIDVDPSLPLDNLDANIVCADALFTDWPVVDAIIGNPPILGDRKIRRELGGEYLEKLQRASGIEGVVDISCHWFRRAHDSLPRGGRAGLVGTSGIRVGKARAATLDYIVERGGTLTNAVSSILWPGEAALNVSMVNWIKNEAKGPHSLIVDGQTFQVAKIPTHLQLHFADVSSAREIKANARGTAMGVIFGHEAFRSGEDGFSLEAIAVENPFVRPVATGDDMLRGKLVSNPDYCIDLVACPTESEAKRVGGAGFAHLKKHVYPMVKERAENGTETHHYARWLRTWWQPREPSQRFFSQLAKRHRFIACSNPQARPVYAFISSRFVPTNTMQIFAFDDDYSFGIIQSSLHWDWTKAKGGRVTERIRYTNKVWSTFPWPQGPSEEHVVGVADAARRLRQARQSLMSANGWSLRALYQAAEVAGPHPLKDAQQQLDEAVAEAYGLPAYQDALEFLLELNQYLSEDEDQGLTIHGPGLPAGLRASDPRWSSGDCIEPPQVD